MLQSPSALITLRHRRVDLGCNEMIPITGTTGDTVMDHQMHRDRPKGDEPPSSGFIDFVLAKAKAQDLSTRQIAIRCDLRRGRCHAILHRDHTKRLPFRVDEINIILQVLKIDQFEASLAIQLLGGNPTIDEQNIHCIIAMVAEFIRGLPTQIAEIVAHIDGLEFDDLKKEHGRWLQTAVCGIMRDEYMDVVRRREFRMDALRL
jgi:hypothetical protein